VEQAAPLRVLLGHLEPIMVIGLRTVLEEEGITVIGSESEPQRLVRAAASLQPDVVVLDLNRGGARALGEEVRQAAPAVKVILWARDETVMEVLDSVSRTPRLVALTEPDGLRDELSSSGPRQRVEE
jgi:DNA-binding NarL/FixJ family response regulator